MFILNGSKDKHMAKKPTIGICRVCGQKKTLTEEHIIPRAAGGGDKIKLYSGDELLKTLSDDEKPYGKIKQNGHAEYTLCKTCNNHSGSSYDKDFSDFYNTITLNILKDITIPSDVSREDYLEGKRLEVELRGIKPLNIAKRILVSFCSVEHPGLTDRKPEIRKAIQDKEYRPKTDNFSVYLSLHVGSPAYYGTVAALVNVNGNYTPIAYAGIEADVLGFHLADHDEHLKGGGLINCLDITEWLTRYKYNEIANVRLELMFSKSLMIRFPIPTDK